MPQLHITAFSLPKEAETAEDNWDAAAFSAGGGAAAVADGATQSFHGGMWARILVEDFVRDPSEWFSADSRTEALASARKRWRAQVDQRLMEKFGGDLPFWIERGLEKGAGATLLGVAFSPPDEGGHQNARSVALAMGDSCLFHVRGGELLASAPFTTPEDFGDLPGLWLSNTAQPDDAPAVFEFECRPGDLVFLATDSLSAWMLSRPVQEPPCLWETLSALRSPEEFAGLVAAERANGSLKDDDTTLLVLEALPEASGQ